MRAINMGQPSIGPMYADSGWSDRRWYDGPREDPAWPEVHTYTDAISYDPGDTVTFHSSTYAPVWMLEVVLDGLEPQTVFKQDDLPGVFHAAPKDAYKAGCQWPESLRWTIPADARSGFYKIISTCIRPDGGRYVQHHFFVVRPTEKTQTAKLLMILPTSTWMAYNDWGGASSYIGVDGADQNSASPELSLLRPWTRGMVWLPEGAPRICAEPVPDPLTAPRYHPKDWAWSYGYGYFFAASGWAQYDRHFVTWAEREGIAFDMITQTDLHYRPEILDRYKAVVIVGHDEYWTHDMRTRIDRFVDEGGSLARFGGNFMWQVRLEDNGTRQVCYKARYAEDPVYGTDKQHLLTCAWESKVVNWPGATTVGVNGLQGIYASWGGFAPRGSKGFTVYREDHWVFEGTQLGYGDIFGASANIFSYEVDGLDYTFRYGLPYPTGEDGAPASVSILAMSPALKVESMFAEEGYRYYLGESDMRGASMSLYGDQSEESLAKARYGSGMLVHMPRGKGEVVTAGTCEWIMGLKRNEFFTSKITRNVLKRFTDKT
ncbi:hypothetical protein H7F36_16080 [Variovorax sp. PAMC28562]|nr:hypothetical protein H7F36_16080 [Variovorax sp. PAMC28562]